MPAAVVRDLKCRAIASRKSSNRVSKLAPPPRRSARLRNPVNALENRRESRNSPSPTLKETVSYEGSQKYTKAAIVRNPFPSPPSEVQTLKRKRNQGSQDQTCEEPQRKRSCVLSSSEPTYSPPSPLEPPCCDLAEPGSACPDPIRHWNYIYELPRNIVKQTEMSSDSKKRGRSYTLSSRGGEKPRAHSRDHEKAMVDHGMVMNTLQLEVPIDDESEQLCRDLLAARYTPPPDSLFHDVTFKAALRGAQPRNEARVVRDLTPSLVPSAELLHIRKQAELPHITEEVDALWDKCNPIFGPRVTPDFSAGLSESAFSPEELEQLKMCQTADTPCQVTADMYFPFLVAEAKSSERTLAEAERQATQSADIAVRAIVELFRRVSREKELHGKILAVSIVHDHQIARMHGYFAGTETSKPKFFRHQIRTIDYTERDCRWTSYNFTRAAYDLLAPKHLERIRGVLAELDIATRSFTSQISVDSDLDGQGSQEVAKSAQSGDATFKKPSLPSTSMLQVENEKLGGKIDKLLQQVEHQRQEQQRQQQEHQRQQQEQQRQQQEQLEQERKTNREREAKLERQQEEQQRQLLEQLEQERKANREREARLEHQQQEQQRQLLEQLDQQKRESRKELEQERKASEEREAKQDRQMQRMEKMMEMLSNQSGRKPARQPS